MKLENFLYDIYLCIKDFCDKSTSTFTSCCICNLKGIKKNHDVYGRRKSCQTTYFCGGNSQRRLREWRKGKEREKEQFESKTLMGLTAETHCVSSGINKLHNYSTKPQLECFKNTSLSFYFESGLKIRKSWGKSRSLGAFMRQRRKSSHCAFIHS